MRLALIILAWLFLATTQSYAAPAGTLPAPFSGLKQIKGSGWQPLTFPKIDRHTRYTLVQVQGGNVVRAHSDNSASGLIYKVHIDPRKYPVIRWRWKISGVYAKGDAHRKSGDDYPARLYVAFAFQPDRASLWEKLKRKAAKLFYNGPLPGSALNYIWANKLPQGQIITNAFSPQTKMVAVESGDAKKGQWVTEQRNILKDYRQAFGHNPPPIVGIGIMTDSDNTGSSATAWYGDITLEPAAGKQGD